MEKINDVLKAEAGDFISYHGRLTVVVSIECNKDTCKIILDNGSIIEEKLNSRLEFFRTVKRQH